MGCPPADLMSLPYWSYSFARKKLQLKIGMHNGWSKVESRKGGFCHVKIEHLISERIANFPSPFKTAESVSEEQ